MNEEKYKCREVENEKVVLQDKVQADREGKEYKRDTRGTTGGGVGSYYFTGAGVAVRNGSVYAASN